MLKESVLRRRIRLLVMAFIVGLALSGLTAIPLRWEINMLARFMGLPEGTYSGGNMILQWLALVREGIEDGYGRYPFLAYGTDWLAFGHIMIALAFIGPLRDPVRNAWVIEWGMIACVMVIPMALIFGPIRQIPFFHRLIDCCFGVFGILPLWITRTYIRQLEAIQCRSGSA